MTNKWHRLQILTSPEQYAWLQAESYTTSKSIGNIIRALIDNRRQERESIYNKRGMRQL